MFERRIIIHPWEGKMTPFKIKGIEGKKTAHVLFIDEKRNLEEEFSFRKKRHRHLSGILLRTKVY